MKKLVINTTIVLLILINSLAYSQSKAKIVICLVIDQMRWEYLNKFSDNYSKIGFAKLMGDGYSCHNTHINYFPTYDSPGSASIYTGTVPSIHGIMADQWYDKNSGKIEYSVDDPTVITIGSQRLPAASPVKLQASTIGDELKLSSNFKSKVYSIGMRDRGAVIAGGHSANASFWYDNKSGKFISSSFYLADLPIWVNNFNNDSLVDKLYSTKWNLLYPENRYHNKDNMDSIYKSNILGSDQNHFPYDLLRFKHKDYTKINYTPFGNTLIIEFAKQLIKSENLGNSLNTDLLLISFASTDFIGHVYTPTSLELEDTYLRLDQDMASFITFLDNTFGKKNYLLMLTSNHGVANNIRYLTDKKISAGKLSIKSIIEDVELKLKTQFGDYNWIKTTVNTMIFLNDSSLVKSKVDKSLVINQIQKIIENYDGVQKVVDFNNITNNLLEVNFRNKIINGIYSKNAGDLLILLKPNYYELLSKGTTHGSAYSYDTHIPLLWYGKEIKPQKDFSEVSITDIAPTLAAILGIQEPNASTGKIIQELLLNINRE